MTKVRISDMTRVEFDDRSADTPILIPVGALEQHGPHLPLDTDQAIAEAFAIELAEEVGAMVAPGIGYGCRSHPVSGGGEIFRATNSISGSTMSGIMFDILRAFRGSGFRNFAFVNGHYENAAFLVDTAHQAVAVMPDLKVLVINWWEVAKLDYLQVIFDGNFPGWEAEHAGIVETSLMMHIAPDRVVEQLIEDRISDVRAPSYTVVPERSGLVDATGVLRTAWGSSARIGEGIFTHCRDEMVDVLRTEFPGEHQK